MPLDTTAYEQLEMERGVCNLQRTYSPELVQRKALESPSALLAIVGRTADIAIRLGTFYGSLVMDSFNGSSDEPERIRLRAAQLRYEGRSRGGCPYTPCEFIHALHRHALQCVFTCQSCTPQGNADCPGAQFHQGWSRYVGFLWTRGFFLQSTWCTSVCTDTDTCTHTHTCIRTPAHPHTYTHAHLSHTHTFSHTHSVGQPSRYCEGRLHE